MPSEQAMKAEERAEEIRAAELAAAERMRERCAALVAGWTNEHCANLVRALPLDENDA